MPASLYDGVTSCDDRALQLAIELTMMNLDANAMVPDDLSLNFPSNIDDVRAKKSQNMTECVPVPSSEHVAEIVGRQGCKIKALRAKTNTYIKTPVRGEEPVFVVTGRKEDVAKAKREILSAADHFSQIRASRKTNFGGLLGLSPPGPPMNVPGQVTIQVRVPYRVVGLVVGPKGATIKRIQQTTHTYIVTPSRDKEPVFEVTGLPENVENARQEIEAHIAVRTGTNPLQSSMADLLTVPLADDNTDILNSIYKTGLGSLFNMFDASNGTIDALGMLSSTSASTSSGAFSSSGSISSSSSSSGGRLADMGSIWSSSLDEGIGESPMSETLMWPFGSRRPSPAASASPTDSLNKRDCLICSEREVNSALVPCGHNNLCFECASLLREEKDPLCPHCGQHISQVIRILSS